jgi:hypothetical protein
MPKLNGGLVLVLICIMVAGFCLLAAAEASAQAGSGTEQGKGLKSAAIFVKGHHAYLLDAIVTDPTGTNTWLHILDIEDVKDIRECRCLYLRKARDVTDQGLIKYDITDPCDPESLSFGPVSCFIATDLYVNNDVAYASVDWTGVPVWDVSDSVEVDDWWNQPFGSPQGIHVRGPYAYIASEALSLWIREINTGTNYVVDTTCCSRDVYNAGFADSSASLTYEGATDCLRLWDTTDPEKATSVGSISRSGPVQQAVHITGKWVYRLGSQNKVEVYPFEYAAPDLHVTYTVPGLLHDIHIVHECYWPEWIARRYGQAHIFAVYKDTDTVALWIHSPSPKTQPVYSYKYGDVNNDGIVNIADIVCLINYTLLGHNGAVRNLDPADVNCDGEVNTYDIDYLMDYVWYSGPAPGADCDFYDDW